MKYLSKYKTELIGVLLGAIGGWFYWKFIGCLSGTCPFNSNPTSSIIFGAFIGWLIFGAIGSKLTEQK